MNVFSQLQQQVIARLQATVADIPSLTPAAGEVGWITEDIGDLANIVTRAVGTLGIIGIVLTPGDGKLYEVGTFPISMSCPILIQIQENVTVNRREGGTKIPSLDLVQFCMKRLHLWSPSNQRVNRIEVDATPYILISEYPILTYNVRLNASVTVK